MAEPCEFVGHWDESEIAVLTETIQAYEDATVDKLFNKWHFVKFDFPSGRGNYTAKRLSWQETMWVKDSLYELQAKIVGYYASYGMRPRR